KVSGGHLTVDAAGNVGLGVSTPGFPLNFASATGDKISLYGTGTNHYGLGIQSGLLQIHGSTAGADIAFGYGSSTNFTEQMRIKGNGNVGIGTAAPAYPLDVRADQAVGRFLSTNGAEVSVLVLGNTAASARWLGAINFNSSSGNPGQISYATNTGLTFDAGGVERLRITPDGGVGIGTSDPAGAALNVAGTVRATQFQGGGADLTGIIPADNSVTSAKILNGAILNADLADNSVNADKIADGSVTSLKIADNAVAAVDLASEVASLHKVSGGHLTVDAAGNVGLGTATPVYPLDVKAAQAVGRFLSTNNASVSFLELGNAVASALWLGAINFSSSNTTPGQIAYATDSGLAFRAGGAERLRITPDGGVGLGTSDPAGAALNVAGTVRALLFQGSGASLTGLNASQVTIGTLSDSRLPANVVRTNQAWLLSGNAGTTAGGQFLGTTDAEPLEFKVDNHRALRLEPIANTTLLRGIVNLVGGSAANLVADGTYGSTIGGGGAEQYVASAYPNRVSANFGTVAGGLGNSIESGAFAAAIGGGWRNTIQTNADAATIGGGNGNQVSVGAECATIGGGTNNVIQTNAIYATIGGGKRNAISNAVASTIGGGTDNAIGTGSVSSTIGGGAVNTIGTDSGDSTIGGGASSHIRNASPYSTIGGGGNNEIGTNSYSSTIGGGENNAIGSNSVRSTIGGGNANRIGDNASYAAIPGGYGNSATSHAFAAGRRAKANHTGAFVWADSTDVDLASLAANSMTLRAAGGVRFFSNSGATLGVSLAANGTSWGVISDRNAKKNFQPVDSRAVLERLAQVPVERWNYKAEADDSVPHLGPMAQDFKAAFYPGRDDTSISTLEFDGVALAAIQGLNQKLEAKNAALEQEMAELKTLVKALAEKVNGGGQ
ncbi:MAG: tail fiber domain-containing protein, partial [Verrucomicrobiota bacterium]